MGTSFAAVHIIVTSSSMFAINMKVFISECGYYYVDSIIDINNMYVMETNVINRKIWSGSKITIVGDIGSTGAIGATGDIGATGSIGATGAIGAQGIGITGSIGPSNNTVIIKPTFSPLYFDTLNNTMNKSIPSNNFTTLNVGAGGAGVQFIDFVIPSSLNVLSLRADKYIYASVYTQKTNASSLCYGSINIVVNGVPNVSSLRDVGPIYLSVSLAEPLAWFFVPTTLLFLPTDTIALRYQVFSSVADTVKIFTGSTYPSFTNIPDNLISFLDRATGGIEKATISLDTSDRLVINSSKIKIGNGNPGDYSNVPNAVVIGDSSGVVYGTGLPVVTHGPAVAYCTDPGWIGLIGYIGSSRRFKNNINDIFEEDYWNEIELMRPREFNYIESMDPKMLKCYGFIAEEMFEINPTLINISPETGLIDSLNDRDLFLRALIGVHYLHKTIKRLKETIILQDDRITALESSVASLSAIISALQVAFTTHI